MLWPGSQTPVDRRTRRQVSTSRSRRPAAPRSTSAASTGLPEYLPQGGTERVDISGRHEDRIDPIGRHVPVAVECAGDDRRACRHRFDQHDTERLAVQRRRTEHRCPAHPSQLVGFGDPAKPFESCISGVLGSQPIGVRAITGDPTRHVEIASSEGLEQHLESLAFLMAIRGRRSPVDRALAVASLESRSSRHR